MIFSLADEPWIPVLGEGGVAEVSLGGSLCEAGSLGGLAATPASMGPVLLRLLVAVVIDAVGPPRSEGEWAERWRAGAFDADAIEAYLEKHRDRFDLFSETAPFAQVAGLRTAKGETKPASLLVPSAPAGNNVPLFATRTEADPVVLSRAEAARWLLHCLAWDPAGIKTGAVGDRDAEAKGKTYGNPTGPLGGLGVVVPVGRTLFETIMLNTLVWSEPPDADDRPHWRRPPLTPQWESRPPRGPLDVLTWVSRRIRLIPENGVDGTVVRSVVLAGGDRMSVTPIDREPHTLWRAPLGPGPDDPPWRPRRHQSGRTAWQGLGSLLALPRNEAAKERTSLLLEQVGTLWSEGLLDESAYLDVQLVGFEYGPQAAVFENLIADAIPLPVAALRADAEIAEVVEGFARDAQRLIDAINRLDADVREAAGGDEIPWDKGQRPGMRLVSRLDPHVRRLLRGLQGQPERVDEAVDVWRIVARREAEALRDELLASVPPVAYAGREVKRGTKTFVVRVDTAERSFRRRLDEVVPRSESQGRIEQEAG